MALRYWGSSFSWGWLESSKKWICELISVAASLLRWASVSVSVLSALDGLLGVPCGVVGNRVIPNSPAVTIEAPTSDPSNTKDLFLCLPSFGLTVNESWIGDGPFGLFCSLGRLNIASFFSAG